MTSPQEPFSWFQTQSAATQPAVQQPQHSTQPEPPKSRQARKLDLQTRQLTDASAALARKLRGDLMLSVLQPLLRQEPARVVVGRFLTAMDHLNINSTELGEEALWKPPGREEWSRNLPADEPAIPTWERLRRLGRNKPAPATSDPVVEWEICYALNKWVNENIPGETIAKMKENARASTHTLTVSELESHMNLGSDFPREWSLTKWWDEQLARRGQGGIADRAATAHEWDHPGLTASRIIRTDLARQLLQKGGIELGIVGGSESYGQTPPSGPRWRYILSGNTERLQNSEQRRKVSLAKTLIEGGIDKNQNGVDKTAEAKLASRVGKYRDRVKSIEERIDNAAGGTNPTNPDTQNLRTDRIGEILQAVGTASAPLWYVGTVLNRAELLAMSIIGGASLVAGIGLKYGLRGFRGLREKGVPQRMANRSHRKATQAHEDALDQFYNAGQRGPQASGGGKHRRK